MTAGARNGVGGGVMAVEPRVDGMEAAGGDAPPPFEETFLAGIEAAIADDPRPICVLAPDRSVRAGNPAFRHLLGVRGEGTPAPEIPPALRGALRSRASDVTLPDGGKFHLVFRDHLAPRGSVGPGDSVAAVTVVLAHAEVEPPTALTTDPAQIGDLLRASADWFWAVDAEGRLTMISEGLTRILGQPGHWLIGHPLHELPAGPGDAGGDNGKQADRLARSLHTGRAFRDLQVTLRDRDNVERTQRLSGVPVYDPATGRFIGFRGAGVDMSASGRLRAQLSTYQQALEETLETLRARNAELDTALRKAHESERAKSRFLAAVGHELRTPLNGIIAYAEAVQAGAIPASEAKYAEVIGEMGGAGRHLLALISDILDHAALEQGELPLDFESVSLRGCVAEAFAQAAIKARTSAHDTGAVSLEQDFHVWADRGRLLKILANLLDNAMTHTPAGAAIGVDAGTAVSGTGDASVEIVVWDDGPGVPSHRRSAIFEPFDRLPEGDAHTSDAGGLGLGLAVADALARSMKGHLRLDDRDGGGSAFVLCLPSADAE